MLSEVRGLYDTNGSCAAGLGRLRVAKGRLMIQSSIHKELFYPVPREELNRIYLDVRMTIARVIFRRTWLIEAVART